MADELPANPAAPAAQDVGGGTLRVTPNTAVSEHNPTLEEQSAEQDKKAKPPEGETEEQKATREAAEAAAAKDKPAEGEGEGEGEEDKTPKPLDFKGTVFEGLSPEMQTKISPFAAAFQENGTLTDAEIAEAAKATGFSEAAVKQFMAGAAVSIGETAADFKPVFDVFGGADGYKEFQAWTNEDGNLTPAEIRTINKALGIGADGKAIEGAKPDYETAAQLMEAPKERWKAKGGGPAPRDVTTGKGSGGDGSQQGDAYANWAQVEKDMNNPLYKSDPAFRKGVESKIARSGSLS